MLTDNAQSIAISNHLAQKGIFNFTLNQWYLFLYCISKRKNSKKFSIEISKFKELFNLSSYKAIREAASSLLNTPIIYNDEKIKVFNSCVIAKQYIIVEFSDEILPYLSFAGGNMTIIYIGYLKALRSKHLIRMYLFASSFRNQHMYRMEEQAFKITVCNKNLYNSDFSRNILSPAKNEINEKTDLMFNYTLKESFYIFYCRIKHKEEIEGKVPDWKNITRKDEISALMAEAEYEITI